jgi:tripartite-type tricarboxylate transporter receptor subunit TctC
MRRSRRALLLALGAALHRIERPVQAASYIGILAPAATPSEVVARLQAALGRALGAPSVLDRMRELGVELATGELTTAAGFGAFIRQEFERSREAAQLAGLKKQ